MSKIYFNRREPQDENSKPDGAQQGGAQGKSEGGETISVRIKNKSGTVQPEMFDEIAAAEAVADTSDAAAENKTPCEESGQEAKPSPDFDKQKIIKYFKRHPNKAVSSGKLERYCGRPCRGARRIYCT